MDYATILDNYETLDLEDETLTPDKTINLMEAWGTLCQNTYSNAETVMRENQSTHLYLVNQ